MSNSRGASNIDEMLSVMVNNLTIQTNSEDIERIFEKYGNVEDVYLPKCRDSGNNKGYAFVRFCDNKAAEDAVDSMNGFILNGHKLNVEMAESVPFHNLRQRSKFRNCSTSSARCSPSSTRMSRPRARTRRRHSRSDSRSRSRLCNRSRSCPENRHYNGEKSNSNNDCGEKYEYPH